MKNVPEMIATGRKIALITAEEPSAVRTRPVTPIPIAAKHAAPSTSTASSDRSSVGTATE